MYFFRKYQRFLSGIFAPFMVAMMLLLVLNQSGTKSLSSKEFTGTLEIKSTIYSPDDNYYEECTVPGELAKLPLLILLFSGNIIFRPIVINLKTLQIENLYTYLRNAYYKTTFIHAP